MKRLVPAIGALALAVLLAAAVAGCTGASPVDQTCRVIVGVTPDNIGIRVGDADSLTASVANTCGTAVDPTVSWSVQDTTVASIRSFGATTVVVVGRARGNTQVRATPIADPTLRASATVLVQ